MSRKRRTSHSWPTWIPDLKPEHIWTGGDSAPPDSPEPDAGGNCGCLGSWAIATFGDDGEWFRGGFTGTSGEQHPFATVLLCELERRGLWEGSIADSNDGAKGREQELCDTWNASAAKHGFTEVGRV